MDIIKAHTTLKKEYERSQVYQTKCMKYLTFLDYSTLEATGKNIESKLEGKDKQIKSMKAKYDEDIAVLKDAVADMQQLLKNPKGLVDILTNPTY